MRACGFLPCARRAGMYIADLTRPVKRRLPLYCEADSKLLETIYTALLRRRAHARGVADNLRIRRAMMWHEFYALRGVTFSPERQRLLCECTFGARTSPRSGGALRMLRPALRKG
jgi:hypothetical protein